MTNRFDGDPRRPSVSDDDDWFATPSAGPTDLPAEVAWQDEPEPPPPPADGLGRRQAIVVLAAIVAVALGGAGILLARSLGGSDDNDATTVTAQVTTSPGVTATTPADTTASTTKEPSAAAVPTGTVLRPGSTGATVTALQQALTSLGYAPGTADGKYGSATTEAVAAFQESNGLTADGIAGAETIAAINTAAANG